MTEEKQGKMKTCLAFTQKSQLSGWYSDHYYSAIDKIFSSQLLIPLVLHGLNIGLPGWKICLLSGFAYPFAFFQLMRLRIPTHGYRFPVCQSMDAR